MLRLTGKRVRLGVDQLHRFFYTRENLEKLKETKTTGHWTSRWDRRRAKIRKSIGSATVSQDDVNILVSDPKIGKSKNFDRATQKVLHEAYKLGKFMAITDEKWAKKIINPNEALHSKLKIAYVIAGYGMFILVAYWIYETAFGRSESSTGMSETDDDVPDPLQAVLSMSKPEDEPVERPTTQFSDVRGLGEIREQLEQVCDYINHREKYRAIGVSAPKGVLLSGPPGCGKTLLGRALAGECGVPFYFVESSSVDGMYVGTGSKRIEQLFSQARKHPEGAIIFFDEIDAIGGQRSATASINPYSRQTINKLLNEMDGFKTEDNILVIGSTNMPDVLDKALVRSGRFDQHIAVPPPIKEDRMDLIDYYLSKVVAADIDVEHFAKITTGMVGADFENIVNLAAHNATRLKKDFIDDDDLIYAIKRRKLGVEQKSRYLDMSEMDLKVTAYHEAGKAIVNHFSNSKEKLIATTIIPRNGEYGMTHYKEVDYTDNVTKHDFKTRLSWLMGGKLGEEVITKDIFGKANPTPKHSKEYKSAQNLARNMVEKFGMGEGDALFMFHVHEDSSNYLKKLVETEVHRLLDEATLKADRVMREHRWELDLLAKALMRYETLSGDEVRDLLDKKDMEIVQKSRDDRKAALVKRAEARKLAQIVNLNIFTNPTNEPEK